MSVMAVTFPILPGKTPEWRTWMTELNGPRHEDFVDSRRRAGVHERTFLQQTPMGDVVIVTLEGRDPSMHSSGWPAERMPSRTGSSARSEPSTESISALR